MGLLDSLIDTWQGLNEEAQEYYEEAKRMSDSELKRELQYVRKPSAKYAGYLKAAKDKGLV